VDLIVGLRKPVDPARKEQRLAGDMFETGSIRVSAIGLADDRLDNLQRCGGAHRGRK
jgi:hypothetical protein